MESFFVIPFTIGLIFLIISLTASYIRWFMALRIKNKVRLKKALSIKWLVVSLVEVFRECLLHIRIFKVNKRLWYMHMSLAFGWFLLILAGHLETISKTGTFFASPYKAIFLDFYTRGQLETGWSVTGFNYIMDILLIFILSGLFLAIYKRFNAKLLGFPGQTNSRNTQSYFLWWGWLLYGISWKPDLFSGKLQFPFKCRMVDLFQCSGRIFYPSPLLPLHAYHYRNTAYFP